MAKPQLHFIPKNHWMNDPNGFIYYKGNYHLFYQYFPYENAWGTMHWGHKISKDLLHWDDLGIAIYPSKPFDRNGAFSGTAIEIDGKMYIYYSATVYDEILGDDIHRHTGAFHSCQVLLISEDGLTFDNNKKQVVVPTVEKSSQFGHYTHTRDPKVFKKDDTYYMLLGTKYTKENATKTTGEILIYESKNAIDWNLISTVEDDSIGNMWECPDYFEVDGQGIVTISPEHFYDHEIGYTAIAAYMPVTFENGKITITGKCELVDLGKDIYACQSNFDKNGVATQIGWMRMPIPETDGKWIGMYTCPRIFEYKNNHLFTHPHPNFKNAFSIPCGDFHSKEARKIEVTLQDQSSINIGGYVISYKDGYLHADRSNVFPTNRKIEVNFTTPKLEHCELEIYTDLHLIEIFINDGEYVLSNIVYDLKDDIQFENITDFSMFKCE